MIAREPEINPNDPLTKWILDAMHAGNLTIMTVDEYGPPSSFRCDNCGKSEPEVNEVVRMPARFGGGYACSDCLDDASFAAERRNGRA